MKLTETLNWIAVSAQLPDSDITVLLFDAEADELVWPGYWDSTDDCFWYVDNALATPTHWATMPAGPRIDITAAAA